MNPAMEFISSNENGVTEEMLTAKFPNLKKSEIAETLNLLLKQNQIEIQHSGNSLIYKSVHNKNNSYENLVLNLIGQSGTSGLWLKDIKTKTNIPHNLVLKILRVLEETRKIKSIKSVKNNRKTYILYDTKPDEDISGGVWFNNNDVDLVFVNKLMEIIRQFSKRQESSFALTKIENLAKLRTIKDFISSSGISEVELTMEDINTLVECLIYDGKIEKIENEGEIYLRVLNDSYLNL